MPDFVSTRRDVLKTGGALVVTFTLAGKVPPALAESNAGKKTVAPDEVDGFLSIDTDGQVRVYSGKVDLGTGLRTALTQIAAEELDVPIDRVTVIQGDTVLTPDQGPTWGSVSIWMGGMQLRQAAATARKALTDIAMKQLGVPASELRIESGTIKGNGKSASYGELVGLWDYIRGLKVNGDAVISNVGDATEALAEAPKRISATYDFTIQTHGSIGPSFEINDGKITCWSASQATHRLRGQLALMMNVPLENVHCLYIDGSGCYGRNGHEDAAGDAALLSRAIGGKPVRVQWMRTDEHGWDPKGPPMLVDLRAGFDDQGNVVAWESEFFVPGLDSSPVPLVGATHAGLRSAQETEARLPYMVRNSAIAYSFPNIKTVAHLLAGDSPLRWAWIRSPGRMQNTFANDSFVDEVAAFIGADPLDFRLSHLNDPRATEVLRRLATLARWEKRPSPRKNRQNGNVMTGRGVSYMKESPTPTYVGAVAEVEVDRRSGEIRVQRFYIVQDCGQIINPDGVANQIEGNILQTVSRTLKEELLFDRSAVTSLHWGTYPILTFAEVPDVVVELIDRPTVPPSGSGEPSAGVVPSAISNAVFDALGVRMRSVPFTPVKVMAAMDGH